MLNEKKNNTAMGQKFVCMMTNWELMYEKLTGTSSGFWDYGYLFPKFVL